MEDYTFNKTRFLTQCTDAFIAGSAVQMSELDVMMYNSIIDEIIDAGNVFVIDQADFAGEEEGINAMIAVGTGMLRANEFVGMEGFMTYYGHSENADSAAMVYLFVMPPEEVLALPEGAGAKPVWTAIASGDSGFMIAAMGQFTDEGVMVTNIAEDHSEELSRFLCAGAYQAYTISMAMRATGATKSEFTPEDA